MPMVRRRRRRDTAAEGVSVKIRRKARNEWLALKPDAHEGYVSWERFEAIRTMVSGNVPTSRHHGAPKHGDALLAGLIRCRRCGRKLTLRYTARSTTFPATAAAVAGWTMAGRAASPSADCGSTTRSRKRCFGSSGRARSRRRWLPPSRQPSDGIRCARRSAAISKRRAMRPTAPSGSTMPPIRPTGWWRANWRRAGTGARPRRRGREQDRRP